MPTTSILTSLRTEIRTSHTTTICRKYALSNNKLNIQLRIEDIWQEELHKHRNSDKGILKEKSDSPG